MGSTVRSTSRGQGTEGSRGPRPFARDAPRPQPPRELRRGSRPTRVSVEGGPEPQHRRQSGPVPGAGAPSGRLPREGRKPSEGGTHPRVPGVPGTRARRGLAGSGQHTPDAAALCPSCPSIGPDPTENTSGPYHRCTLTTRLLCQGPSRSQENHIRPATPATHGHTVSHSQALTLIHANTHIPGRYAHSPRTTTPNPKHWEITRGGHPPQNRRRWPTRPTPSTRMGGRQVSLSTPIPCTRV